MVLTAVLVTAAATWLCVVLFPGPLPTSSHPDFVDNIFDSRVVIWAARLLLVSAAFVLAVGGVFIVVSTVIRMRNGDWLRRAGPFEVTETVVRELEDQVLLWRSAALDMHDEIEDLKSRIQGSIELIEELTPT
jgi:hypothetical protein